MFEGDYPMGAAHDPRAPYNEVEKPVEIEKDVIYTLRKRSSIETTNYNGGYNDDYEKCYIEPSYSDSDECYCEEWKEQHYTVKQLLDEYGKILAGIVISRTMYLKNETMMEGADNAFINHMRKELSEAKSKLNDIKGWVEEDITVED